MGETIRINLAYLEQYLHQILGHSVKVKQTGEIGSLDEQGMKDFGYGKAIEVVYKDNTEEKEAVLSIMRGDKYGHQFFWDRAAILMFEYETAARMAKHVKPLGLGYINEEGRLIPVQGPKEFFLLKEKADGHDYFRDLERIHRQGLDDSDIAQAREFARWLARIHAHKHHDPDLYYRRIRQLIGDSECIWGIVDTYPFPFQYFPPERFRRLEKNLIDWRWKLHGYTHRLAAVHGDFHPWNVLVRPDGDFSVLDRSRGEWGEPADDMSSMSCNYFLYGLYQGARLSGDFLKLYMAFWEEYLERTDDMEILEVVAPFYVFRCLVIANPEWYPDHPPETRECLFRFLENVLSDERFDYGNINKYLD